MMLDQSSRCLPEGAGMDLHRQSLDATILVELDGQANATAASWRAHLRAPVLMVELMRVA
jgi:hypothetical protein